MKAIKAGQSFEVVREFEREVAAFAGAKYGVAVRSCTDAIFLSMLLGGKHCAEIMIPAHTFISVPFAILQAGKRVRLSSFLWEGGYWLWGANTYDGALRFRRNMYRGGLHCLSFHARKLLNIGTGGMILTDSREAAENLRAMAYCGRRPPHFKITDVSMMGYNCYMHPETAARGLHLLEYLDDNLPDQKMTYDDLREVPYFKNHPRVSYENKDPAVSKRIQSRPARSSRRLEGSLDDKPRTGKTRRRTRRKD